MSIEQCERDGERLVLVSTPVWEAEIVVSNNSNLIRLRHVPTGTEVFRTPETLADLRRTPECYGIPLLAPPGRIDGGRFRWNGRDYTLPLNEPGRNCHLHGLLRGKPWTLVRTAEQRDTAEVTTAIEFGPSNPDFAGFPFQFWIEQTYEFGPGGVRQETRLKNTGIDPFPFGIGYHTTFRFPAESADRYRVMATTGEFRWELSDQRKLPTGKRLRLTPEEQLNVPGGLKIGNRAIGGMLCELTTRDGFRGVILESPESRITYEIGEGYHLMSQWNDGGGKGFLCLEPQNWMPNAPNLDLPPEVTGFRILAPNETRTFSTKITVEKQ